MLATELNEELGSDPELRLDLVESAINKRVETRGGDSPEHLNEMSLAQAALDLVMGWKEGGDERA